MSASAGSTVSKLSVDSNPSILPPALPAALADLPRATAPPHAPPALAARRPPANHAARTPATASNSAPRIDRELMNPELYLNRELTWLSFNWRVLHEGEDRRTPLLERVKFLAITASNLDEFFMK